MQTGQAILPAGGREIARRRFAELSSGVGAGVLGAGVGALLAGSLRAFAVPILVVGVALHAWGMMDKQRIEQRAGETRPRWSVAVYWACWLALAALVVAVAARAFA